LVGKKRRAGRFCEINQQRGASALQGSKKTVPTGLKGFLICWGYAGQPNYYMKPFLLLVGIISLLTPAFATEPAAAKHLKVIQTTKAIYPLGLMRDGISHGSAKVALHVNAQGQLADLLVVAYTHKAFAAETERVIKKWKFEPEYVDGEPIDSIIELTMNYEVNGVLMVQRINGFVSQLEIQDDGYVYQACSLKNLDAIPTPLSVVTPLYPADWAEKGITGKVVVDFYIDETGKTRFAAASSGESSLLAGIAVAAVQKWQFAPPSRAGKPVLVHAQQAFEFNRPVASAN